MIAPKADAGFFLMAARRGFAEQMGLRLEGRVIERPDLFRVKPGSPGESYLYLKVLGDGGIDGGRMPLNQVTFDPRLPALIATWIDAGAPVE